MYTSITCMYKYMYHNLDHNHYRNGSIYARTYSPIFKV